MSNINKAAVLNPFSDLTANILNYVPRATTSEFGIVAIGSGINVDALGRIYLDTQEYSDRLTAIEAQAASTLATQQTAVAAAIAQVNLAQSQTITALTLEVSNLKTDLTNSITATQTDLINRADQLAQDVTDITVQLTQDKATFTQEIQDALVYLQNESSVASALRTPRKIQGVDFDGTQDISLDVYSKAETDVIAATPDATETVAGKAKIATTAIAQEGTNDTDIITALKLKQSFTSLHGDTGWEKLPDGLIIQWGLAAIGTTTPFPIAFPTACYQVAVSHSSSSYNGVAFAHQAITATRTGVTMDSSGGVPNSYIAIGR